MKLTIEQLDQLLIARIMAMRSAIGKTRPRLSREDCEHWITEVETLEQIRTMMHQASPNFLESNYARFK